MEIVSQRPINFNPVFGWNGKDCISTFMKMN